MWWTRGIVQALRRRARAAPVAAVGACLVVALAGVHPSGAAPASITAAQSAQSLTVTPKVLRQLRRALLRSGESPRSVVGPLWGRECIPDRGRRRECKRYTVEYTLYENTRWALAYFLIERQEEDVVFLRRGSRRWNAQRGFGSQEPIPCPVLRDWGRPC
jgi:hypothetical protein